MNEINDLLDTVDDRSPSTEFAVRDLASADWTVRKIVAAERRIIDRQVLVAATKDKLDRWLADASKEDEASIAFLQETLASWVKEMTADQKRRSVKLPSGTAGFRKTTETLVITDEAAALDWCKGRLPDAVKTTERVLSSVVFEHVKRGMELPDWAELRAGRDTFTVKEATP